MTTNENRGPTRVAGVDAREFGNYGRGLWRTKGSQQAAFAASARPVGGTRKHSGYAAAELRERLLAANWPLWGANIEGMGIVTMADYRWCARQGRGRDMSGSAMHLFAHRANDGDITTCDAEAHANCTATAPNKADGKRRARYDGEARSLPRDVRRAAISNLQAGIDVLLAAGAPEDRIAATPSIKKALAELGVGSGVTNTADDAAVESLPDPPAEPTPLPAASKPEHEADGGAIPSLTSGQEPDEGVLGVLIERALRRMTDSARNRAVELRAMEEAERYLLEAGWTVTDVSGKRGLGYDLHCTRGDEKALHVEVKGTTTDGSEVTLTRNEVTHAREWRCDALFVLCHIDVRARDGESPVASGGTPRILCPWGINDDDLTPLVYSYRLPKRD